MKDNDLKQIDELLTRRLDGKIKDLPTKKDLKYELKVLKDDLEDFISGVFKSADDNKAEKKMWKY